jgi:hypothetical protein
MKIAKKLLASALALTLPCAAFAQAPAEPAAAPASAAEPAPVAPAPPPAKKKEAPKPILTPYGFVMVNGYFDGGGLGGNDNLNQAARGARGGALLFSARNSRLGLKLALRDDNWTGAEIGGLFEFDFKAGFVPSITVTTGTPAVTVLTSAARSNGWYNGLMRLRQASLTANWKGDWGKFQLEAGQDYGLVNVVNAETLAWLADPIFTQAGNVWRRSPQFRVTYGLDFASMVNLTVAAAILSPADSGSPVDNGLGNQSRRPDIEARAQIEVKVDKDLGGKVGFGYHTNWKRFNYGKDTQKDVNVNLWGLDAIINLTEYLELRGEYYNSSGAEDSYQGLFSGLSGVNTNVVAPDTAPAYTTLDSHGFWAQAIIKPIPEISLVGGYGQAEVANRDDLFPFLVSTTATRTKNLQMGFGVIFNAGKYWRFAAEYGRVTSTYLDTNEYTAQQTAVSTQLKF